MNEYDPSLYLLPCKKLFYAFAESWFCTTFFRICYYNKNRPYLSSLYRIFFNLFTIAIHYKNMEFLVVHPFVFYSFKYSFKRKNFLEYGKGKDRSFPPRSFPYPKEFNTSYNPLQSAHGKTLSLALRSYYITYFLFFQYHFGTLLKKIYDLNTKSFLPI